MTALLFSSPDDPVDLWLPALRTAFPDLEIRVAPEFGDKADIEFALVYKPPAGMLSGLQNLRLIQSVAAGCDHILADPDLPAGIPICRMVDDYLRAMMSEWAIYAVLHFHRDFPAYRASQDRAEWNRGWPEYTPETDVGVLGLGAIGADVAGKLAALDFRMHGWSQSPKSIAGVTSHHGPDGLSTMLGQCRYLVNVLPLTDSTRGIINAETLAAMPAGSYVINLGRGGHVVDEHLLAALDSGHIAGAFLDVFNTEPLPPEHPYWGHPSVVVTPHVAGELVPRSCVKVVEANVRRMQAGEPLLYELDRERGY